jgi:hypothetical protein
MQLSKALELVQTKHRCTMCSISFVNGDSTRVNYTTVHGDMYENVLLEDPVQNSWDISENYDEDLIENQSIEELNELQMLEAANHVDMYKWNNHVQDQLDVHLEGKCEDR